MQQPEPRITGPGKNEFSGTPHSDHLIENDVRGHPHQSQLAALLADHLVPRGKWNQMTEALQRHRVAIMYELNDCFF